MRLYIVDVYEDSTIPRFTVYFVRSSSREGAEAAVESVVVKADRVIGEEVKEEHQGIYPDLPRDTPVYFTEHEVTWMRWG